MTKKKIKIYIAGPMSGYPGLNWGAFDRKEKELTDAGFDVVNPAKMDRELGVNPHKLGEYDYEEAARRDIDALFECDAIYLMAGFQFSKGACWERALARKWGLIRYYEIPRHDHELERMNREYDADQLELFSHLMDEPVITDGYSSSDDIRLEEC